MKGDMSTEKPINGLTMSVLVRSGRDERDAPRRQLAEHDVEKGEMTKAVIAAAVV